MLLKLWSLLPNSKKLKLFLMRFFQDEFLIGVTGIILNSNNQVLLVNHTYRDGEKWSLPGGYIKGMEHPKEGLAREIEEETGFIVRVNKVVRIRTDRDTARLDISLVGELIGGEFKKSEEVSEAKFFDLDDLPLLSQSQLLLIHSVAVKETETSPAQPKITRSFISSVANYLKRFK